MPHNTRARHYSNGKCRFSLVCLCFVLYNNSKTMAFTRKNKACLLNLDRSFKLHDSIELQHLTVSALCRAHGDHANRGEQQPIDRLCGHSFGADHGDCQQCSQLPPPSPGLSLGHDQFSCDFYESIGRKWLPWRCGNIWNGNRANLSPYPWILRHCLLHAVYAHDRPARGQLSVLLLELYRTVSLVVFGIPGHALGQRSSQRHRCFDFWWCGLCQPNTGLACRTQQRRRLFPHHTHNYNHSRDRCCNHHRRSAFPPEKRPEP